jgi:hypothetical protein
MPTAILDSNLLVLLAVGSLDRSLIQEHKRTSQFTEEDFDLLLTLLNAFDEVLVTPNGLTETSNLLQYAKQHRRAQLLAVLAALSGQLTEEYIPSRDVAASPVFTRLGLADAAIVAGFSESWVLTDDLDLYLHLASLGRKAINFNHYRLGSWGLADLT